MKSLKFAALAAAVVLAGVSAPASSATLYVRGTPTTKPAVTTLPPGVTVVKTCQNAGPGNITPC